MRARWLVLAASTLVLSLAAASGCGGGASTDQNGDVPQDQNPGGTTGGSGGATGGASAAGKGGTTTGGSSTGGAKGGSHTGGAGGMQKCDPIAGIDPSTLGPPCCMKGPAHCVPTAQAPASLASAFDPCMTPSGGSGLCMPDNIISKGSNFKAPPCNFTASSPGVCLSICIGLIHNDPSSSILSQKDCKDSGDVCVPCVNPLTQQPTGACDLPPVCANSSGSGGSGGSGGSAGSTGAQCPYTGPPIIDPNMFQPCAPACNGAHCLPSALVPMSVQSQLAPCMDTNGPGFCAPDTLIESGGNGVPPTCKSVAGVEGRCLSTCLPAIAAQASLLPKDTCGANEVCAPCYNPFASDPTAPTGACSLACDKPKDPPFVPMCPYTGPAVIDPNQFPACSPACGGAHCVPASLVPASQASQLATCPGGYCAPDFIVKGGGASVPATCVSVAGAEGRCLSTCLPEIAAEASLLPKSTCGDNEVCAPCYNPFASDPTAPTGACSLACDKPTQPPTTISCGYSGAPIIDPSQFPACSPACGGAHCVPNSVLNLPPDQAKLLAACPGGYCTPDSLVEYGGKKPPKTCTSVAGAEGRCLSTCLPDIAAEASLLPQDTCDNGEVCAPCFNPFAADPTAPTGACNLPCDMPTKPPVTLTCGPTAPNVLDPTMFPACSPACGGAHCLPSSFVSADQAKQLAPCPGGYCAPDTIIATGGKKPPKTCTSVAGSEGRCLSTCLPAIAAEASLLPTAGCDPGEVCAPCYNPTAADPTMATGACSTVSCDAPQDPPTILSCPWTGPPVIDPSKFPSCCAGAHCLPSNLVSASQTSLLASCDGGAGYCVPDEIISTAGNFKPPTCDPFGDPSDEGRCLSTCLAPVAAQASQLQQQTCASGDLCVPCTDPLKGTDTGACSASSCDMPAKPPFVFPGCCYYNGQVQGTCVPKAQTSSSQQSSLQQDECPTNGADYLCVPEEYLPGNESQIQTCTTWWGASGACVSKCLNLPITQYGLSQGSCPANHLCAPCSSNPPGCQ